MMKEKEYRPLPGRGTKRRRFFDIRRLRTRLWLGKDHLLCHFFTGYTEDYKRFYYSDIQAITARKTIRFMIWNIILSSLLIIAATLGYVFKAAEIPLFTTAAFILLFLLVNLGMGQTCVCRLYTQASVEELYSLNRLRTARKVIKIISPIIEGNQRDILRQSP